MNAVALFGRDYPDLGPVGAVALPDGGALALSRGQEPKPYRHVDPNEDAALLVRGEAGALLAVADGYNGVATSEAGIEAVRAAAGELITDDAQHFEARLAEVLEALRPALSNAGRSRSCLVVAALVGERCCWASLGDSSLFRASQAERVTPEDTLRVLGPALWLDDELRQSAFGSFERKPGERVALVSDGITNFLQAPDSLIDLLAGDLRDGDCAREIALAAMRGGAGDNVAVALLSGPV